MSEAVVKKSKKKKTKENLRQQKTMFLCVRWNWPGLRGGKLRAQICAENLGTRGMLVSVWHGRGIPAPACRAESLLGGSSFRFQL